MVINYIYLILILILITSIYYFIYLSYEYRGNGIESNNEFNSTDNNMNILNDSDKDTDRIPISNAQIENFIDLTVNIPNINSTNSAYNQINKNLQSQQEKLDSVYNSNIASDNKDYITLNKQLSSNVSDTYKLLKKKQALESIPNSFPIDRLINTIKSNYNSQYLSLFANDIYKYGVLINDKCFTVNGLCKDEFCIQKCQNNLYASPSQKFYTDRITSDADITRLLKVPADKINSKNVYPFNIFRSTVNDKCLSINNDGIGIEDCNLNSIHQQWMISPDENICILK